MDFMDCPQSTRKYSTAKTMYHGRKTMSKSQQRKGADGERELVNVLNGYGFLTVRGGSQTFGTVPDVTGLPGIHIEVKRVERLNIAEAMRQAVADAERFRDGMPTVFHRRNRQPWLVTMRLQDWVQLYSPRVSEDH